MICNRSEDAEKFIPYLNKPVYIKGYCWNKLFDGWVVIYDKGVTWLNDHNYMFDYRGVTYPLCGFLPNKYTSHWDSSYNNAIYKDEV